MKGTPIDGAHDWTHELEFERAVTNRSAREMARFAADLLQTLQNCASARGVPRGLHEFDADEIRGLLDAIRSYL